MPNQRRITVPGSIYHVISQFVAREWFIAGDEERETYFRMLANGLAETDWICLAYAVMSSHIHIAAIAGKHPLEGWMRRANSPFGEWINHRLSRIGAVFARPDDYLVSSGRVGSTIAYIHNNPVRAGVVRSAAESEWTSHQAYLAPDRAPAWLAAKTGLELSGFADPSQFDAWVATMPGERPQLDPGQIERARLARDRQKAHVAADTQARIITTACASTVLAETASALGIDLDTLRSRDRHRELTAARRVAVHAGLALGLTQTSIAAELGLSPQAVSCARDRGLTTSLRAAHDRVVAALRTARLAA